MPDTRETNGKWIPAKIDWEKESNEFKLTWLLRGDWRFKEPFFMNTLSKHMKNSQKKTTGMELLLEYFSKSGAPDPSGFIFHLSRCGSTTISQMLARDPENMVLSEPGPAEGVLGLQKVPTTKRLAFFVGAMKAFASSRIEPEKLIFVKFSGSDVWLPWMQLAYPKTPWIFVYRHPAEVLKSNLQKPPPWVIRVKKENRKTAILRKLKHQMSTIIQNASQAALLVNHEEIDVTFPPRLLQAFKLPTDEKILRSMEESLQWYSKREGRRWVDLGFEAKRSSLDSEVPPNLVDLYDQLEALRKNPKAQ